MQRLFPPVSAALATMLGVLLSAQGAAAAVPGAFDVKARPTPPAKHAPAGPGFSFTAQEVASGRAGYGAACASCHGNKLEGGGGPPLTGKAFMGRWTSGEHTLANLDQAVRRMPKQSPGGLPPKLYGDLLAYILSVNGYAPGKTGQLAMNAPLAPPSRGGKAAKGKPAPPPPPQVLPAAPPTVETATTAAPTDEELHNPAGGDWLMYNRDYQGQRYSPLAQITAANAGQLQPVCMLQLGVLGSFQSSPLIYKGVGYATTSYTVHAFDAATCKTLWSYRYTPEGPETLPTNRGAALYDGKLFRGTTDGHLLAFDAVTGKLLWNVHVADSARGYFVGAAPIAYKGRVIVGLAGGDYGANGHVYAFDARTGQRVWTFDTIPTGKQPGAETWQKGSATGGGATWTTVSIDPAQGLVFVPVGNPGPDFASGLRPGLNLYTNSVVALDAATGKLAWYVQQSANDPHDWDTAAAPALYEQDGRRLMAVGSKDGYVYIYDRDTHALVSKGLVSPRLNPDVAFTDKPLHVCPGAMGGVEWFGPAYDPTAKTLFVNSVDWCAQYNLTPPVGLQIGAPYAEGGFQPDPPSESRGWLRALDAVSGHELWAYKASAPMVAGVTPTAGGVVLTGGTDGDFLVFDPKDGKVLYRFNTGGAIGGGVSTYMVGERQYVAVASGNRSVVPYGVLGAATVVVFALPPAH